MAIFIALIIFVGIVIHGFSTSSIHTTHNSDLSKEKSDLEDIYLIDEDVFKEDRDGFI